ncbi:hypothetical protein P3H80_05660 [Mycolicibacterium septicum]|nr:hypothetical protein [Mycolicibacterium septicum]MDF3336895.1 hypothetical protein [Mycolicibacterium septicum]
MSDNEFAMLPGLTSGGLANCTVQLTWSLSMPHSVRSNPVLM